MILSADSLATPTPSPNVPEVATVVDDVRYYWKSGPCADVEFPAEFDPQRTYVVTPTDTHF
jgi:hypothetical protein